VPYPLAICCLAFDGDGHPVEVGEADDMKDDLVYVVFEDDFADVNDKININTRVMIKEEAAIFIEYQLHICDLTQL